MKVKIANKIINLDKITHIHVDKDKHQVIFNIINDRDSREENSTILDWVDWYINEDKFDKTIKSLELMLPSNFIIPPPGKTVGRSDIINLNNVSYIRFNDKLDRVIFNFAVSRVRFGELVTEHAYWDSIGTDGAFNELKQLVEYSLPSLEVLQN